MLTQRRSTSNKTSEQIADAARACAEFSARCLSRWVSVRLSLRVVCDSATLRSASDTATDTGDSAGSSEKAQQRQVAVILVLI